VTKPARKDALTQSTTPEAPSQEFTGRSRPKHDLDRASGARQDNPFILRAVIEEGCDEAARWAMVLSLLIKAGNEHGKSNDATTLRSVRPRLAPRAD
jgi:hypothetical protein